MTIDKETVSSRVDVTSKASSREPTFFISFAIGSRLNRSKNARAKYVKNIPRVAFYAYVYMHLCVRTQYT